MASFSSGFMTPFKMGWPMLLPRSKGPMKNDVHQWCNLLHRFQGLFSFDLHHYDNTVAGLLQVLGHGGDGVEILHGEWRAEAPGALRGELARGYQSLHFLHRSYEWHEQLHPC